MPSCRLTQSAALLQWLIQYSCTRSFLLYMSHIPVKTSSPTDQPPASPAFLSPAWPPLPHYRWPLTLSVHSSPQRPCWLRSLSWVDRTNWSRPSLARLRAGGQGSEDRLTVATGRKGWAPAAQEESHRKMLERGGRRFPAAQGGRVSMSHLPKESKWPIRYIYIMGLHYLLSFWKGWSSSYHINTS